MTLCVGLTGGIGCGKSTVADLLEKHGAGIVDTDVIAHRLTQAGGVAIPAIRSAFGSAYIHDDGALNRVKMRRLIFSDATAKLRLEMLLHPLILEQAKLQLQQLQTKPYTIIVVPLLAESPASQQLVQRILVVDCTEETQAARVIARSRMSEAEVRTVIAQQTPRAERLKLADDVIHNDSDTDSLTEQVAALHKRYLVTAELAKRQTKNF
jgi:dephospho-CoA kinase